MSVWHRSRSDTDPDTFRHMAQEAYRRIPVQFRRLCGDILIQTPDLPQQEVLTELGIDSPYGLLGLYHGIDVTRKTLFDTGGEVDRIFLYRLPILRFWHEGTDSLEDIVTHVLVHEIGHHFGLSDDDMHDIEEEN
jgi:predicted Zn-dependent protease with MMP-like domain